MWSRVKRKFSFWENFARLPRKAIVLVRVAKSHDRSDILDVRGVCTRGDRQ